MKHKIHEGLKQPEIFRLRKKYVPPLPFSTAQDGAYRIQNSAIEGYLIWIGVGSLPDITQPGTFSSTLPINIAHDLPGSGTQTIYVIARKQDGYGCQSQNQNPYIVTLNSSGPIMNPVPALFNVKVYPQSGGALKVIGSYPTFRTDLNPADEVNIWVNISPPTAATYTYALSSPNFSVIFGSYSPGTYTVNVGLYRTSDSTLSPLTTVMVVIPPTPQQPIVLP